MVIGSTKIDFVSIENVSDWASSWDDLILKSSETWYRHLRLLMSYTKIALSNKSPLDLSFFINLGPRNKEIKKAVKRAPPALKVR